MNQPKMMTDEEATPLDHWLVELFEDMLFNPEKYENKKPIGGPAVDAAGTLPKKTLKP